MFGRIAACGGAAAIALGALFSSSPSSAKSLGISPPHTGSIAAHGHRHGHNIRGRGFARNGSRYPYGYGYGYGYGYPYVLPEDTGTYPGDRVIPLAYPVYAGPRCVHSVDFVKVPSELGGDRIIRITRC